LATAKVFLFFGQRDLDQLAGKDARNEYNAAIFKPGNAFAACDELFNTNRMGCCHRDRLRRKSE
jgi:hypothetical protein